VAGSKFQQAAPERIMCETVRMKVKMKCRPQEAGEARDVDYLQRKS
jgi:hypothetical protein